MLIPLLHAYMYVETMSIILLLTRRVDDGFAGNETYRKMNACLVIALSLLLAVQAAYDPYSPGTSADIRYVQALTPALHILFEPILAISFI